MEEKIALFWHGIFATGYSKLNQARSVLNQIDMFQKAGSWAASTTSCRSWPETRL